MPNIKFKGTDRCPCESGKIVQECCLRAGGNLLPRQCKTETSAVTGHAHPKCYAAELGQCSTKISREHFVSEGVLLDMSESGVITVQGLPWQDDPNTPEKHHLDAASANVLCTNHNTALSTLDSVGIRFMKRLAGVGKELNARDKSDGPSVYLFNGHDLERWVLKMLCGVVSSGNAAFRDNRIAKSKPPLAWLQLLFGIEPFPPRWGLYLLSGVGEKVKDHHEIGFAPLVPQGLRINGCVFSLCGFRFLLAMETPAEEVAGTLLDGALYRPDSLAFRAGSGTKTVTLVLGWDAPGDEKGIVIDYAPQ